MRSKGISVFCVFARWYAENQKKAKQKIKTASQFFKMNCDAVIIPLIFWKYALEVR